MDDEHRYRQDVRGFNYNLSACDCCVNSFIFLGISIMLSFAFKIHLGTSMIILGTLVGAIVIWEIKCLKEWRCRSRPQTNESHSRYLAEIVQHRPVVSTSTFDRVNEVYRNVFGPNPQDPSVGSSISASRRNSNELPVAVIDMNRVSPLTADRPPQYENPPTYEFATRVQHV